MTTRCSILVGRKKTVFDTDAHENKRKKKKAGSRTPVSRVRAPPLLAVPRKKSAERESAPPVSFPAARVVPLPPCWLCREKRARNFTSLFFLFLFSSQKLRAKAAGSRTPVSRVRAPPLLAVPRKKSAERESAPPFPFLRRESCPSPPVGCAEKKESGRVEYISPPPFSFPAGSRTPVSRVRVSYDNHLHYREP